MSFSQKGSGTTWWSTLAAPPDAETYELILINNDLGCPRPREPRRIAMSRVTDSEPESGCQALRSAIAGKMRDVFTRERLDVVHPATSLVLGTALISSAIRDMKSFDFDKVTFSHRSLAARDSNDPREVVQGVVVGSALTAVFASLCNLSFAAAMGRADYKYGRHAMRDAHKVWAWATIISHVPSILPATFGIVRAVIQDVFSGKASDYPDPPERSTRAEAYQIAGTAVALALASMALNIGLRTVIASREDSEDETRLALLSQRSAAPRGYGAAEPVGLGIEA